MVGHNFSVEDAWAAACAAQRINGDYIKDTVYRHDESTNQTILVKHTNRVVMLEHCHSPDRCTAEDRAQGAHCRNFLQQDLTFRAVKNQLTSFDLSVQRVLAVDQSFNSHSHRLELAVLACLPSSVARSQTRQAVEEKIAFARGGLIGKIGEKISTNVEVISAVYSQQFNIYWIRAITDQDQPVMFSNRAQYDTGTWLTIQGKVKAHRNNLTQLNYVKVL